ncbi:hypothetical protein JTE90_012055 [Oedothorax gibbosus]|uniref:Uncharacterized protein n=1 Tax=Oedothorax gibbosus TaxID=931172 RepID=A0AAV6TED3_9ARAC|nr:hypothetical protein JTE90_012055 [Oedothorax gibbosus]
MLFRRRAPRTLRPVARASRPSAPCLRFRGRAPRRCLVVVSPPSRMRPASRGSWRAGSSSSLALHVRQSMSVRRLRRGRAAVAHVCRTVVVSYFARVASRERRRPPRVWASVVTSASPSVLQSSESSSSSQSFSSGVTAATVAARASRRVFVPRRSRRFGTFVGAVRYWSRVVVRRAESRSCRRRVAVTRQSSSRQSCVLAPRDVTLASCPYLSEYATIVKSDADSRTGVERARALRSLVLRPYRSRRRREPARCPGSRPRRSWSVRRVRVSAARSINASSCPPAPRPRCVRVARSVASSSPSRVVRALVCAAPRVLVRFAIRAS